MESEEFKLFLAQSDLACDEIKNEIEGYIGDSQLPDDEKQALRDQLVYNYAAMLTCLKDPTLSSTQKSILLRSYTFSSSSKNSPTNEDALFAITHAKSTIDNDKCDSRCFASVCAAIHVIEKSKTQNGEILAKLKTLKVEKERYLNPGKINSLRKFEEAATKIRNANLPLKQQKKEIFAVLKEAPLPIEDLKKLKKALKKDKLSTPLKFINQPRSKLWMTRKVKGISAKTKTTFMMLEVIKEKRKTLEIKLVLGTFSSFGAAAGAILGSIILGPGLGTAIGAGIGVGIGLVCTLVFFGVMALDRLWREHQQPTNNSDSKDREDEEGQDFVGSHQRMNKKIIPKIENNDELNNSQERKYSSDSEYSDVVGTTIEVDGANPDELDPQESKYSSDPEHSKGENPRIKDPTQQTVSQPDSDSDSSFSM